MPFDNAAYSDRWCVTPGKTNQPRAVQIRSDAQVLYAIWQSLETGWAKKLNDGANHCVLGWVTHFCSPTTIIDWSSPQIARLLRRLHDELPRSVQRKRTHRRYTLAKYNDRRDLQAARDLVFRAYLTEVNERMGALSS
jgi:hypothetical protein